MSTEQQAPVMDVEMKKKLNAATRDGIKLFLDQNHLTLMKLLFNQFDSHKIDFANFGQDALLDILSEGNQVCCQGTMIQVGSRRLVLQSYLRLEEPVSQQASTPVNQQGNV